MDQPRPAAVADEAPARLRCLDPLRHSNLQSRARRPLEVLHQRPELRWLPRCSNFDNPVARDAGRSRWSRLSTVRRHALLPCPNGLLPSLRLLLLGGYLTPSIQLRPLHFLRPPKRFLCLVHR